MGRGSQARRPRRRGAGGERRMRRSSRKALALGTLVPKRKTHLSRSPLMEEALVGADADVPADVPGDGGEAVIEVRHGGSFRAMAAQCGFGDLHRLGGCGCGEGGAVGTQPDN